MLTCWDVGKKRDPGSNASWHSSEPMKNRWEEVHSGYFVGMHSVTSHATKPMKGRCYFCLISSDRPLPGYRRN